MDLKEYEKALELTQKVMEGISDRKFEDDIFMLQCQVWGAWEVGMDCSRKVPKRSREFVEYLSASNGVFLHGELGRTQADITV